MKDGWLNNFFKPTIFYVILFLFILAFSTTAKDYDYDFWSRLIAGMGFVQTGHVLKQDFLSYSPTHIWYDHEWGSGVIFYLTQHFFSSTGILLLQSILVFLIFFVMTKVVSLRGVKTTSAYNFLFYYFSFISMNIILNEPIRCQLFSFLFFTLFLYILELSRKGNTKPLWAIPFIMIVWNNLHGGSVSGIGLILIYIFGEFLNRNPIKKYIYALTASLAVLPINPWGFQYLGFLFKANTMHRTYVAEWWGLFSRLHIFNFVQFKLYTLILLFAELALVINKFHSKIIAKTLNVDKTKILVLFVTIILAIQHIKLIPFAVISMTCFLYDDFYTVFNKLTKGLFNKIVGFKETIVYLLIIMFALWNIRTKAFEPLVSVSRYPIDAIEFVKVNNLKGNLLINFGLGSYASYKLYPNNKIFIDGRYEEVYYDEMMPMLNSFYMAHSNWNEVLKRYPTDILVIEKNYPIYKALNIDKDWKMVYENNFFGVFVQSRNAKKTYKQPSKDINYYKKTLFDTDIKFNQ